MRIKTLAFSLAIATAATTSLPAAASELYRSNLESGLGWGINSTSGDVAATFGFDYGAAGVAIPEAPNTRPGDAGTRGVKLEANLASPAGGESLVVYPIGENFTGNYQVRFDAWMNIDLDAYYNNGAAGTTEFIGGGLGYNDTDPGIGTGAQMLATGDGGSGSDWRVFAEGAFLTTSEMAAGTRNGFDPYYSDYLPEVLPPAGQAQTYVGPDGSVAGSPAFQWVTFQITTANGVAGLFIEKPGGDLLPITATSRPYTSDGNIGLVYADFFSSVAAQPSLQFGLIDNVEVSAIPEPSSLLLVVGALAAAVRRRG